MAIPREERQCAIPREETMWLYLGKRDNVAIPREERQCGYT